MSDRIIIKQQKGNFGSQVERKIEGQSGAVLRFDSAKKLVGINSETYSGSGSYQPLAQDLEVSAAAGGAVANPKFLSPFMGNILGDSLTALGNYLAGGIGAYSITGTKASHWPTAGLLGVIMDGVTDVDGAVVAHLDGSDPSAVTTPNAAFKAMQRNTNAASGYNYGLDLLHADETIGGDLFYGTKIKKGLLRSPNEVVLLEGGGVPTDGGSGTGVNFAGKGSEYTDYTNGEQYINKGTKASPTWKKVTTAA